MPRKRTDTDELPERRRATIGEPDPRASVAVVGFQADRSLDGFARAATGDVIRAFGGLATWLAVEPASGAAIRGPIELSRLRQMTKARYILHGSVETEREMVRLSVELSEAGTGRVLWSRRFDHWLREQTALREHAASRIARSVPPLLLQRELDRTALLRPADLTARDRALRAYTVIMQPESGWLRDADALLSGGDADASTHFVLVWRHLMAIDQGCAVDLAAAVAAADEMDRDDPAAMAVAVSLHSGLHGDHRQASTQLDRVINASPVCAMAWTLKSLALCRLGEGQPAVYHAEQAQTMPVLGPERAWRDQVTALAHYIAGRYTDAVRWARVSAMQHPGLAANAQVLAASLAVLGLLDEASQAASQVLAIDPAFRIGAWRERSRLAEGNRDIFAQRLRLAGLPG
jgi:adenylate cyclase